VAITIHPDVERCGQTFLNQRLDHACRGVGQHKIADWLSRAVITYKSATATPV
jgi:hypothetical protein